jgi:hypothetical protein
MPKRSKSITKQLEEFALSVKDGVNPHFWDNAKNPYEMTDEEAREELNKLQYKFAGPHGPGNPSLDSKARLIESCQDQPRIEALRERLGLEYWQRTKDGVYNADRMPEFKHRQHVQRALEAGKKVPLNVLQDYQGEQWADNAISKLYTAKNSFSA